MRILLAHNHYQSAAPSGEDSVFSNERALLANGGHEVVTFERHNDAISDRLSARLRIAMDATWSRSSYRDLSHAIQLHRPDVAHFHNTFPLLSPSAYQACRDADVPVVQTLHNYRLICPGALLLRDGHPCEECVGGSLLPAVRHGCYRGSKAATAVVATMLSVHRVRQTYRHAVDRYIALTAFAKARFIRGGLPAERIVVRPNCLMDTPEAGRHAGNYALYVGRLSTEKGVRTLIDAWQGIDLPLQVVGDGALRSELETAVRSSQAHVSFLGFQARPEVLRLMQDAAFVVIPSECYEGFPVTVLEALATGTALIVSAIGALDELIDAPAHGRKFATGNPQELRQCVRELLEQPGAIRTMQASNRRLFEERYSTARALQSLLDVYQAALGEKNLRQRAVS